MSFRTVIETLLNELLPTVDVSKSISNIAKSARQWFSACVKTLDKAWRQVLITFVHISKWSDALSVSTKLILGLVFFLTAFFIWQLMAYELEQTIFVTVNLLMVTMLSVATCWILLYTQRELADKDHDIVELDKKIERYKSNLKKVKADLFEIKDKQRKDASAENIVDKLADNIKSSKQKQTPDDSQWQWLLNAFARSFDLSGGIVYARSTADEDFSIAAKYALADEPLPQTMSHTDGYIGQVTQDRKPLILRNVPSEFLTAVSGLGKSKNLNVYIFPIIKNDVVLAVAEITTFGKLPLLANWDGLSNLLKQEA